MIAVIKKSWKMIIFSKLQNTWQIHGFTPWIVKIWFYFSNVWSLQMGDGAFWVKLLLIICSVDIKRFVVFFFLSYLLFLFVIFLVFYVFVSFNFAFYRVTQERLKILTRCSLQQNWKTRQLTVLLLWT